MTISSHLPDVVDSYIAIRSHRLLADKAAAELKEQEEELKDTIIAKLREGNMTALGASNDLVKMSVTSEPVATDWPQIWEHVRTTGDFSLLHKRITTTAIKEQWADGVVIPGVIAQDVYRLTVSGVKK